MIALFVIFLMVISLYLMAIFYPDTAGFHGVMALISPLYSHQLSYHVM